MQKKYFKYILVIVIMTFVFSMHVMAAKEISMNINETKGNVCTYQYNGIKLDLYETSEGKLAVKDSGSSTSYNEYNIDYLTNERYIKNRTCPNIYATPVREFNAANQEIQILYFYFNKNEVTGVFNSYDDYETTTVSGNLKRLTHTCVYSATSPYTSEKYSYVITYNASNGKIKGEVERDGYTSMDVSKNLKKAVSALKYDTNTGLACSKDLVVIDFCRKTTSSQGQETASNEIYFRTGTEAMKEKDSHYECKASTNPKSGVTVKGDKSKGKVGKIYSLAKICKEEKNVMIVFRFIGYLLFIVKILVPLGLIAIGVMNFAKVVISGNDDELKKNVQKFGLKLVLAVVVFVLPTIINFIIGLVDGATDGTQDYENCRNCIFDPKNCKIPE